MARCWLGAAMVFGALAGCQTQRPAFVNGARETVADRLATDPLITARSQKPDGDPTVQPTTFLDRQPQRPQDLTPDRRAARIWATVNGKPILEDEVRESAHNFLIEIRKLPEPVRSVQEKLVLRQERERLIEQELLLQQAYERLSKAGKQYLEKLREEAGKQFDRQLRTYKTYYNLKTDQELKDFLSSQGMSLEGIRRQKEREFIARAYLQHLVGSALDGITPADILEYYRQHPDEFQAVDRVKWQDIFIDASQHAGPEAARRFAEQLAARARAGEDFVALAEQYDNGYSRNIKGAGAGELRGQISPDVLEPYLFDLRDGEVGPVVEMPTGFHIFRVVKREYAGKKPFDEKIQTLIRDKLREEIGTRRTKEVLNDLRRMATIEVPVTVP